MHFLWPKVSPFLRRFATSRGGNIAMLWGLLGAALIAFVGVTVDFTRAQALRAQMQNAADGAALVAERTSNLTDAQRTAAARAFFDQSLGAHQPVDGAITFSVTPVTGGGHRVDASGIFDNGLSLVAPLLNHGHGGSNWTISVSAEAVAQVSPPIEVALALDNTGSMVNDMQALRSASTNLANTLYNLAANDPTAIKISVVPFVAQVNVGSANTGMIDTTGLSPQNGVMLAGRYLGWRANSNGQANGTCTNATSYPATYGGIAVRWINGKSTYPTPFNTVGRCYAFSPQSVNMYTLFSNLPTNARWGGCVEARLPPYDIQDTPPGSTQPATLFTPYFALDEGGDVSGPDNNWITNTTYDRAETGLGATTPVWTGYNTPSNYARTLSVYKYRSGVSVSVSTGSNGVGPNRGCPTPIVPLTNYSNRNTVLNAISNLNYWNGGGTNQIEGLAWAWRVLSPGAPFTEGRPYHDPNDPVRKVIVLFTDGDNTSLNSSDNALESDYAGFSYRSLWRTYQNMQVPTVSGSSVTWGPAIPTSLQRTITGPPSLNGNATNDTNALVTYMNARQRLLCDNIKAVGIEIYTVGFRISAGGVADNLLQYCATDTSHFYHADSQSELAAAFTSIGSGIGQLRITH